jgi:hypothetical protein
MSQRRTDLSSLAEARNDSTKGFLLEKREREEMKERKQKERREGEGEEEMKESKQKKERKRRRRRRNERKKARNIPCYIFDFCIMSIERDSRLHRS